MFFLWKVQRTAISIWKRYSKNWGNKNLHKLHSNSFLFGKKLGFRNLQEELKKMFFWFVYPLKAPLRYSWKHKTTTGPRKRKWHACLLLLLSCTELFSLSQNSKKTFFAFILWKCQPHHTCLLWMFFLYNTHSKSFWQWTIRFSLYFGLNQKILVKIYLCLSNDSKTMFWG